MLKVATESKFSLKMKGRIYLGCARSAMLYASEAWCLRENKIAILRTEKPMIRALRIAKFNGLKKKCKQELINLLGLEDRLL